MKCQSCGHEILEPVITGYCTNCGKPIVPSIKNSSEGPALTIHGTAQPVFVVHGLNSALFPVAASVIPVAVLSYFAGGVAPAIGLTLLDLILAIVIYLRVPTFQFLKDKVQIFDGIKLRNEISYSQIKQIIPGTSKTAEKNDAGFVIEYDKGTPAQLEIPSNPSNLGLKMDLRTWLSQKVSG